MSTSTTSTLSLVPHPPHCAPRDQVLAEGNNQDRAILHTVLAISSSCMCALLASSLVRPAHKFDMVDVQNGQLSIVFTTP